MSEPKEGAEPIIVARPRWLTPQDAADLHGHPRPAKASPLDGFDGDRGFCTMERPE